MVFDIEIGLNEYRFGFHGGEEEASNLLAELVRDGVRVLEFREKPVDLEEAFFQLTRGEVA
ncbi:MAG: hypothetical protein BWZ10_01568 [candidate division BRC1 bacterium ADurb.BinA364]|nr:MAG: hypothetical protein BWZ10_01568 [candidate division BRC1 bacterium ADurb.BinA364]